MEFIGDVFIVEDERATIGVKLKIGAGLEMLLLKAGGLVGSKDCGGAAEEARGVELGPKGLMTVELGRTGGTGAELGEKGTKLSTGGKGIIVVNAMGAVAADVKIAEEIDRLPTGGDTIMPEPTAEACV